MISARTDIKGRTFGRLTAMYCVGSASDGSGTVWRCKCACGAYPRVRRRSLLAGATKSCGCLRREYQRWAGVEGTNVAETFVPETGARHVRRQYKTLLGLLRPLVETYTMPVITLALQQLRTEEK